MQQRQDKRGHRLRLARAANPYYAGPPSDHFDGTVFFNPGGEQPNGLRAFLAWQLSGGRTRWPRHVPSPFPPAVPLSRVDDLRISMIGHASVLVQWSGLNILLDPLWSERASPLRWGPPRRVNPPGVRFEDLPPIDAVLVSHNHYDHLDAPTLRRLGRAHDPLVVTPLGNDRIIGRAMPGARVVALDWGGHAELGAGRRVHVVPAHHWSARGLRDRRMALWGGFVLEGPAGTVFFAGDTSFDGGRPYAHVRERFGEPRLAVLPIGAYAPRWFMRLQHQDPAEAVEGMLLSGAAWAAGVHWGTFQLTDEGVDEPRRELLAALDRRGVGRERFLPLRPGQVWDVPASRPADHAAAGSSGREGRDA